MKNGPHKSFTSQLWPMPKMNTLIRSHLILSAKARDFLNASAPDAFELAKKHSKEVRHTTEGVSLVNCTYEAARNLKDYLPQSMQAGAHSNLITFSE